MRTTIILGVLLFVSFFGLIANTLHSETPPEIGTALHCVATTNGIECWES